MRFCFKLKKKKILQTFLELCWKQLVAKKCFCQGHYTNCNITLETELTNAPRMCGPVIIIARSCERFKSVGHNNNCQQNIQFLSLKTENFCSVCENDWNDKFGEVQFVNNML